MGRTKRKQHRLDDALELKDLIDAMVGTVKELLVWKDSMVFTGALPGSALTSLTILCSRLYLGTLDMEPAYKKLHLRIMASNNLGDGRPMPARTSDNVDTADAAQDSARRMVLGVEADRAKMRSMMAELAWTKLAAKTKALLLMQRHVEDKASLSKSLEKATRSHEMAMATVAKLKGRRTRGQFDSVMSDMSGIPPPLHALKRGVGRVIEGLKDDPPQGPEPASNDNGLGPTPGGERSDEPSEHTPPVDNSTVREPSSPQPEQSIGPAAEDMHENAILEDDKPAGPDGGVSSLKESPQKAVPGDPQQQQMSTPRRTVSFADLEGLPLEASFPKSPSPDAEELDGALGSLRNADQHRVSEDIIMKGALQEASQNESADSAGGGYAVQLRVVEPSPRSHHAASATAALPAIAAKANPSQAGDSHAASSGRAASPSVKLPPIVDASSGGSRPSSRQNSDTNEMGPGTGFATTVPTTVPTTGTGDGSATSAPGNLTSGRNEQDSGQAKGSSSPVKQAEVWDSPEAARQVAARILTTSKPPMFAAETSDNTRRRRSGSSTGAAAPGSDGKPWWAQNQNGVSEAPDSLQRKVIKDARIKQERFARLHGISSKSSSSNSTPRDKLKAAGIAAMLSTKRTTDTGPVSYENNADDHEAFTSWAEPANTQNFRGWSREYNNEQGDNSFADMAEAMAVSTQRMMEQLDGGDALED